MIAWTEEPVPLLLGPGLGGDPLYLRSPTRQAAGDLDLDRLPLFERLKGELRDQERFHRGAWTAAEPPADEQDVRAWAVQARAVLPISGGS